MSDLLSKLATFFIAPPADDDARLATRRATSRRAAGPPARSDARSAADRTGAADRGWSAPAAARSDRAPASAALLAPAADLTVAGGDLAAELRRREKAAGAVVCLWPPPERGPSAPFGLPGARALAARLADRGHDAQAAGALCVVHLPAGATEAAAAASRVLSAAPAPAVLALANRDPAFNALLADVDLLAVSRREDDLAGLAELAAAALTGLGPPVSIRTTPSRTLARRRAALGVSRPHTADAFATHAVRAFGAPRPPDADVGATHAVRAFGAPRAPDVAVRGGLGPAPSVGAPIMACAAESPAGVGGATATHRASDSAGQATLLVVGALCALLVGVFVLGGVARGVGVRADAQRAADIAALAGARAMHGAYPRLFEPAVVGGRANPAHLEKWAYLQLGRGFAIEAAERNGAGTTRVSFPDGTTIAPVRIRVTVSRRVDVQRGEAERATTVTASAEAELAPTSAEGLPAFATGGGYSGPLEYRQGKPMRPDAARAFDRLAAAARADGVQLLITSAFRSDAEQAVLWARHPDPRWVAPPGKSLHRYGTELDLGPPSAYGWLATNAPRFHFIKRYAWEAWHFGFSLNPRSSPRRRGEDARTRAGDAHARAGERDAPAGDDHGDEGDGLHRAVPAFVPAAFAGPIADAAQRWNVSATLLAAQLYAESGFNPFAVSPAGARGIAQFMPATARAYGLRNPFDAARAIDAQAHLMRDLLREFAAVPLALAAYNAGPGRVRGCGCVPPIPETRGYVARILGLMGGAGEGPAGGDAVLAVRLVA